MCEKMSVDQLRRTGGVRGAGGMNFPSLIKIDKDIHFHKYIYTCMYALLNCDYFLKCPQRCEVKWKDNYKSSITI